MIPVYIAILASIYNILLYCINTYGMLLLLYCINTYGALHGGSCMYAVHIITVLYV